MPLTCDLTKCYALPHAAFGALVPSFTSGWSCMCCHLKSIRVQCLGLMVDTGTGPTPIWRKGSSILHSGLLLWQKEQLPVCSLKGGQTGSRWTDWGSVTCDGLWIHLVKLQAKRTERFSGSSEMNLSPKEQTWNEIKRASGTGRLAAQELIHFISVLQMNNFRPVLQSPKAITLWRELATVRFISPPS